MSNLIKQAFPNLKISRNIRIGTEIKLNDYFSISNTKTAGYKDLLSKCTGIDKDYIYGNIRSNNAPWGRYRKIKREYLKLEISESLISNMDIGEDREAALRSVGFYVSEKYKYNPGGRNIPIGKRITYAQGANKDDAVALLKTMIRHKKKKL